MTTQRPQVLVTGVSSQWAEELGRSLEPHGLTVHEATWEDAVLDLVERVPFAAVVAAYPLGRSGFGLLLSAARARASACRPAGFVAVAAPGVLEDARKLLGRGVNRVVSADQPVGEVVRGLMELFQVAPRLQLHVTVRVTVHESERRLETFCQTENVSATGMLLRRRSATQPGTLVEFQIQLPGFEDPVEGSAEIIRVADPEREGVAGFGTRFLAFNGTSRERWQEFLESSLHLTLQ